MDLLATRRVGIPLGGSSQSRYSRLVALAGDTVAVVGKLGHASNGVFLMPGGLAYALKCTQAGSVVSVSGWTRRTGRTGVTATGQASGMLLYSAEQRRFQA